jgi:amino-acid racemase
MKTIGLIGGMSWESSLEYYRIMNEAVRERLGGFHSAKCIMYSVDFAPIEKYQHQGKWDEAAELLIDIAQKLERCGAELLVICANTMHKLAEPVQKSIKIPLLHIADVTAERIKEKGMKKLGLLGTQFTMEEDFYKDRLIKKHGLTITIPDKTDRELIHEVLYGDIQMGKIEQRSRDIFKKIIGKLADQGAEGIILGCTEIPLYVKQEDCEIPLFNTTEIHARSAVEWALGRV